MSKNMAWKYTLGEWQEIPDPIKWDEGEDFDATLERNGYYGHPSARWGREYDEVSCDLYSRRGDERYPVLLSLCLDGTVIEQVFIYDFPSMMQFMREYQASFAMGALQSYVEEAMVALRRAFHAWHGHDHDAFCRECDPDAWSSHQKYMREHAKKLSGS